MTALTSADFDTQLVGSHIIRNADGAFLVTPDTGVTALANTDAAHLLPVGSKVIITATDSLVMHAFIPTVTAKKDFQHTGATPASPVLVETTDLTTIDDLLGGLSTWATSFATP
mgnify:CR=1 FL=1